MRKLVCGGLALGMVMLSGGAGFPQSASLLPPAQLQFSDQNGAPLAGGKVQFCQQNTGCATLKPTWKDPNQTQQNPNPLYLDSAGRATIYGAGSYEMRVYDVFGNTIYTGLTSAFAAGTLANSPGLSIIGNAGGNSGPVESIPVQPPLGFLPSGKFAYTPSFVVDTTNQIVNATFSGNFRLAQGSNPLSYSVPSASSFYSGFSFTIVAQVATTVNFASSDTLEGTSSPVNLISGQSVTFTTDGNSSWVVQVTRQTPTPVLFPGQVVLMRGQVCPTGTLPENGAAVSRTTYAALFAALGTSWGAGDGSTTFNLPNAGGQFNRGWETGQTVDPSRVFGSTQLDQLQDHTHSYNMTGIQNSPLINNGASFTVNNGIFGQNTTTPVSGRHGSETRPTNITALSCVSTGLNP